MLFPRIAVTAFPSGYGFFVVDLALLAVSCKADIVEHALQYLVNAY